MALDPQTPTLALMQRADSVVVRPSARCSSNRHLFVIRDFPLCHEEDCAVLVAGVGGRLYRDDPVDLTDSTGLDRPLSVGACSRPVDMLDGMRLLQSSLAAFADRHRPVEKRL